MVSNRIWSSQSLYLWFAENVEDRGTCWTVLYACNPHIPDWGRCCRVNSSSKDKLFRNGRDSRKETCRLTEKETQWTRWNLNVLGCILGYTCMHINVKKCRKCITGKVGVVVNLGRRESCVWNGQMWELQGCLARFYFVTWDVVVYNSVCLLFH